MSMDIDTQAYMGVETVPAAAEQALNPTNSYSESQDYPVYPELMEKPQEVAPPQPSEQELYFKALREEVDRIKTERESERKEHSLQLDLMRANLAQNHAPAPQSEKQMFDGVSDDYIPNVAELRREWQARESAYQAKLEELEVQAQYPDYLEVLNKYTAPLVRNKPHLARTLQRAENPALVSYELGKMAQQMQSSQQPVQQPTPPSTAAQRMVDNSRKPGTLSQAGGQSALSKADYYASMSDAEFMKLAGRHLESI